MVLFVFAAGFFTMHGFLAVSASADLHGSHDVPAAQAHEASPGADTSVGRIGATSTAAAVHEAELPSAIQASVVSPAGQPDPPAPAEHHDVVAGCVVALVGITVIALALLSWFGVRGPVIATSFASPTVQQVRSVMSRWSPPRIALCVIRV